MKRQKKKTQVKQYLQIRMLMVKNGITQEELAKKMGLGKSTLNKKLNGKSPWLLNECFLLADILGAPFDHIFLPKSFPNGNENEAKMAQSVLAHR